jgi:hypothetical protein
MPSPICVPSSLQVGSHAAQMYPAPVGLQIEDLTLGHRDFADSAAAIAGLDLTISIDTAAANLAGALGAPLWVAVPFVPDFRWGEGRQSKWYPSANVYRQPAPGTGATFAAMAKDLTHLPTRQIASGEAAYNGAGDHERHDAQRF